MISFRLSYFLFAFIFHTFHITKIFLEILKSCYTRRGKSLDRSLSHPRFNQYYRNKWFKWSPTSILFLSGRILSSIIFFSNVQLVKIHENVLGVLVELPFLKTGHCNNGQHAHKRLALIRAVLLWIRYTLLLLIRLSFVCLVFGQDRKTKVELDEVRPVFWSQGGQFVFRK